MIGVLVALMLSMQNPEVYMLEENCSYIIDTGDRCISFDEDDIDLMARVVMSEAGGQSDECKEAVVTTILNRVASPRYSNCVSRIVEDAYSTADNGPVTDSCYLAVYSAIAWWGSDFAVLPKQCYYLRGGHYHSWALAYRQIDDLYFSVPKDAVLD